MGIFHDLIRTYDANAEFAGIPMERGEPLCPMSHNIYNAQIEIVIDGDGNFFNASAIEKTDQRTIIPTTEASVNRTKNPDAAHPLCEQLEYLAPNIREIKHNAYLNSLRAWEQSDERHPFLTSVLAYIQSGTILADLCSAGVICLDKDGNLAKGRIDGTEYGKCLVRWRVLTGTENTASWECRTLFDAYHKYYMKHYLRQHGICCLTGEDVPLVSLYDKGVLPYCHGAKIVSANDTVGFTYRGRCSQAWQVAQIGYEASQKLHRALRWVANHNGVRVGSRMYVCWSPTANIFPIPDNIFIDEADHTAVMTTQEYWKKIANTLKGRAMQLPDDDEVIMASLDAATTGRLSITQYGCLSVSEFRQHIQNWYESFCWPHFYYGIKTPRLGELANYAYGNQRKQPDGSIMMEANEAAIRVPVQQLYNTMIYGKPLSYDMVRGLIEKAKHLHCYPLNIREELLMMACAVFRKYENDKARKEVWSMALEKEKRDRSYQFGRLLAIYEKIERDTYGDNEKRESQAIRLQTAYIDRPMRTAMILQRSVGYYLEKQRFPGIRQWYRDMIDQIMAIISEFPENELDKRLEGSYLLGYSLQRIELTSRKRKQEEE